MGLVDAKQRVSSRTERRVVRSPLEAIWAGKRKGHQPLAPTFFPPYYHLLSGGRRKEVWARKAVIIGKEEGGGDLFTYLLPTPPEYSLPSPFPPPQPPYTRGGVGKKKEGSSLMFLTGNTGIIWMDKSESISADSWIANGVAVHGYGNRSIAHD